MTQSSNFTSETHTTRRQRERRAEKRAAGHCRDCRARTIKTGGRCPSCWEKFKVSYNAYRQRRVAKMTAKGFCRRCLRRKKTKGYTSCCICREKARGV